MCVCVCYSTKNEVSRDQGEEHRECVVCTLVLHTHTHTLTHTYVTSAENTDQFKVMYPIVCVIHYH